MTDDLDPVARLAAARAAIQARIDAACARAGRDPADVQLVAISKTVSLDVLQHAPAAGLLVLGENRVQEAAGKVPALPEVEWHLVGHLQGNKAAKALELFSVIQSVDSLALAQRLARLAAERGRARVPVYLQVNVDADPAKEGFPPDGLAADLPAILDLPGLEVRGLMTVGLLVGDAEAARPTFVRLRQLSTTLRAAQPGLGAGLSMGMSDDFEVAVEEGSTLVRVGRAIFGERPRPAVAPGDEAPATTGGA
ncbi:MAG: YggS family pyridoxal phosphate-dependent enzyme [Chloroflexota bacterium]